MHRFLKEICETKEKGGDCMAVIRKYARMYRNVYFYNDSCAKYILTEDDDLSLLTDLVNASLHLTGCECITDPQLENPVISGGLVYRGIEHDILLSQPRVDEKGAPLPGDRIAVEFQHLGGSFYGNRLLFYVARSVSHMLKVGVQELCPHGSLCG